jgi:hypothetical protein
MGDCELDCLGIQIVLRISDGMFCYNFMLFIHSSPSLECFAIVQLNFRLLTKPWVFSYRKLDVESDESQLARP